MDWLSFSILFCVVVCFLGKRIDGKLSNPASIFFFLWGMILFLNSLGLYGLKTTRPEIYRLISYGLLSFFFGYIFFRKLRKRHRFSFGNLFDVSSKSSFAINYSKVYVLCYVCIVFSFIDFVSMLALLMKGGGLALIRYTVQNSAEVKNGVLNAMNVLVVVPFFMALQPMVAVDFWLGKRDKKLLMLNGILILMRVLSLGGRAPIMYFFLNLLFVFSFVDVSHKKMLTDQMKRMIKKSKRMIRFLMFVGLALLLYTTFSRNSTIETLYYYFAMEPYMFDEWAHETDVMQVYGGGLASLNGFAFSLFYLLKNILGIPFPEAWNTIYALISNTDSQWKIIADGGTRANAYVSLFWFFYTDARLLGVIIGSFLYGSVLGYAYMEALRNTNLKSVCVYSFLLQGLLFSFVRMQTSNVYYSLALVFIFFVLFKRKEKSL